MPTNIPDVIGTRAPQRRGGRVLELLDVNFVGCGVIIVLHPKHRRAEQVIVIGQLRIPDSMNLLTPTDRLVGSKRIDLFEEVR